MNENVLVDALAVGEIIPVQLLVNDRLIASDAVVLNRKKHRLDQPLCVIASGPAAVTSVTEATSRRVTLGVELLKPQGTSGRCTTHQNLDVLEVHRVQLVHKLGKSVPQLLVVREVVE